MQQMLAGMQNPDKDPDLDPNTGGSGLKISEEEGARAGHVASASKVLDSNSGIDPLTQFNLDPNLMHTASETDDRSDPNTGRKPLPAPAVKNG